MKRTLALLSLFAVAMALLEAAVVVYMRRLYYPENPLELFPLRFLNAYEPSLELSREVATIAMLLSVALLAERRSLTRSFAAFVFLFGLWDLFYYAWLKVLMDWPQSWLEWDVLFLIPGVWLGPWICPALISLLFITWGFAALKVEKAVAFTTASLSTFVVGAGLGLAAFLQPATTVTLTAGAEQLSAYTPGDFWWWLFLSGYLLMAIAFFMTFRGGRRAAAEGEDSSELGKPRAISE